MFKLEEAITNWRERLSRHESFTAENVAELEGHLRDSAKELQSQGLSDEESFLVAKHRLGSEERLDREFGKNNTTEVWMRRFIWALVGLVCFRTLGTFYTWASEVIYGSAKKWTDGHGLHTGLTVIAAQWFMIATVIYEAWYLFSKRGRSRLQKLERAFEWAAARPILIVTVISVTLLLFLYVCHLPLDGVRSFPYARSHFWPWVAWRLGVPVMQMVGILGIAYLLHRHLQRRSSVE